MGDVVRGPWQTRRGPVHTKHTPAARRSPAWAVTAPPSGLHCSECRRVFAAGHLPTDGELICRDCRAEAAQAADPALFDLPEAGDSPS